MIHKSSKNVFPISYLRWLQTFNNRQVILSDYQLLPATNYSFLKSLLSLVAFLCYLNYTTRVNLSNHYAKNNYLFIIARYDFLKSAPIKLFNNIILILMNIKFDVLKQDWKLIYTFQYLIISSQLLLLFSFNDILYLIFP